MVLGTDEDDPCRFWRLHEKEFPTLAALARDVFSVPATGAGVERLFSSARDICHYRRGSLNTTTIQDLMMLRCMTRFDAERAEARRATESEDPVEQMEADEEEEGQLIDCDIAVISDDEEERDRSDDDNNEDIQLEDTIQPDPIQDYADGSEDDSTELPLPIVQVPQVRIPDSQRPQRERKRRRDEDQYEYPQKKR